MPALVLGLEDPSTAVGRLIDKGHGDPAARWSLLDLPDIDLPCPFSMILPDSWDSVRFLKLVLSFDILPFPSLSLPSRAP